MLILIFKLFYVKLLYIKLFYVGICFFFKYVKLKLRYVT